MTAQETSENILKIASRLFIKKGYTATSMREIAAEAGIGKATIYYHFPDKEAIATALITQTFTEMRGVLKVMEAEPDPRKRITRAVTESVDYLLDSADFISIIRREIPGSRDMMQMEFRSFVNQYLDLLADAVRRGIDQGTFRPVDPDSTARVVMTMIQGSFAFVYMSGIRHLPNHHTAENILDVFFKGIDASS